MEGRVLSPLGPRDYSYYCNKDTRFVCSRRKRGLLLLLLFLLSPISLPFSSCPDFFSSLAYDKTFSSFFCKFKHWRTRSKRIQKRSIWTFTVSCRIPHVELLRMAQDRGSWNFFLRRTFIVTDDFYFLLNIPIYFCSCMQSLKHMICICQR